jgi:hypothetical protein
MKYLFFCLIIPHFFALNAQLNLSLSFNSIDSGRNIALAISKTFNSKNEFGGGVKFNISKLAHNDDQNNVYKKRLYPTEFIHHLGITGFYHRFIITNWEHVKPFIFYDLQVAYSTTRNRMLLPYTYDNNGDVLYKEHIEFFGPFTWVEQNIGIGFKIKLFDSWFIQQKIGFGTSFILGYDEMLLNKYFNWFEWEFGYLIHVGIGYKFRQKVKQYYWF